MAFTARQELFINEYLKCFNATEAAKKAGYRGNDNTLGVTGHGLLRNPKIQDIISKRLQAAAMSADEVLARLGEQARADYTKYIDKSGRIDLESLIKDGKQHLIRSVKETRSGGRQIEFYDGQQALVTLARHHGLLTDTLKVKLEDELNSALDLLEKNLDTETYNRVLEILASSG